MVFDRSNGIYRSVFVALIGLVLVGAGGKPAPRADTKQAQTTHAVADKADNTDTTAPKTDKSESKDHGCKQGQDDRQSDLCAQWKAADAAADAARSSDAQTFIGWIGLLLGGITMGAAIAAAIFAKRAADHTKTGADAATAAHESFVASERATIRARSMVFHQAPSGSKRSAPYRVKLRVFNGGKATAVITEIKWSILQGPIFPEKHSFSEYRSEFIDTKGEIVTLQSMTTDYPGDDMVWIMGFFNYNSLGRKYRTHFCYQSTFESDDGYAGAQWRTESSDCQNLPEDT